MAIDKKLVDEQISALGDFAKWFTKKERNCLHEVMSPKERIYAMTSGLFDGKTWLVTVTDKRILFLDKGMISGLKQIEWPLSNINAVSYKTGVMFGQIVVSTASGTQLIDMIEKADVPKVAQIISDLINKSRGTVHSAAVDSQGDIVSFKFNCPNCTQKLEASEDMIGETIECPICKNTIKIQAIDNPKEFTSASSNSTMESNTEERLNLSNRNHTPKETRKEYLHTGFTEKQRASIYQKVKKEWEDKGWKAINYFNGGIMKRSYIEIKRTINVPDRPSTPGAPVSSQPPRTTTEVSPDGEQTFETSKRAQKWKDNKDLSEHELIIIKEKEIDILLSKPVEELTDSECLILYDNIKWVEEDGKCFTDKRFDKVINEVKERAKDKYKNTIWSKLILELDNIDIACEEYTFLTNELRRRAEENGNKELLDKKIEEHFVLCMNRG